MTQVSNPTRQQTRRNRRKEVKTAKRQGKKLKTAMAELAQELFQKPVKDLNESEQRTVVQTFLSGIQKK